MLSYDPEVIRLLHRERAERLTRSMRRLPAAEQLTEPDETARPVKRRRQLRLREGT